MRIFAPLILVALIVIGCAAIPRKTTLTDIKSGEVCHGGFNLFSREGWVSLPDGTKLTGKIFGVTDAQSTSQSFSGNSTIYGTSGTAFGSFSGTGNSFTAAHQGQGWALLRSPDGKLLMEIQVISNGSVTAGYGEATMNDGRSFRVVW
jgi:hypothetical protein